MRCLGLYLVLGVTLTAAAVLAVPAHVQKRGDDTSVASTSVQGRST